MALVKIGALCGCALILWNILRFAVVIIDIRF